jgi:hypothetical protein
MEQYKINLRVVFINQAYDQYDEWQGYNLTSKSAPELLINP